ISGQANQWLQAAIRLPRQPNWHHSQYHPTPPPRRAVTASRGAQQDPLPISSRWTLRLTLQQSQPSSWGVTYRSSHWTITSRHLSLTLQASCLTLRLLTMPWPEKASRKAINQKAHRVGTYALAPGALHLLIIWFYYFTMHVYVSLYIYYYFTYASIGTVCPI